MRRKQPLLVRASQETSKTHCNTAYFILICLLFLSVIDRFLLRVLLCLCTAFYFKHLTDRSSHLILSFLFLFFSTSTFLFFPSLFHSLKKSCPPSSRMNAGALSAHAASLSTSTERAIEVLAGLVGRTHVKEEIVHGSYRCIRITLDIVLVVPIIFLVFLFLFMFLFMFMFFFIFLFLFSF
jgi:hypothetical protein